MPRAEKMESSVLQHLGDYRIRRELAAGRTFLAEADGARLVVLKRIDPNCLLGGQLHPTVRDRLSRLKELADPHVAALLGVERLDENVYLVWEYVEGLSVDQWLARQPSETLRGAAREVVLAVQALHAWGIVHGALVRGNILVDSRGVVRLIDISPLLYYEPMQDAQAVVDLIDAALQQHADYHVLRGLLLAARSVADPLANLRLSLASGAAGQHQPLDEAVRDDSRRRNRLWAAAIGVAAVGVVIALLFGRLSPPVSAPDAGEQPLQSTP